MAGYLFNEPIGQDKQSADRTLPVAADMEKNANVGGHALNDLMANESIGHTDTHRPGD
jgi:hypothetical protein